MNATKPAPHNPDNLTPEQYGAADGWRLLRKGELIPSDAEGWYGRWEKPHYGGIGIHLVALRTRTPDPYADKPASGWIKMSERKPTEADLPVVFWNIAEQKAKYCAKDYGLSSQSLAAHSHWMRAPFVPPPRELTQDERDEAWIGEHNPYVGEEGKVWACAQRRAIAYERTEIARMIPSIIPMNELGPVLQAIYYRVEGTHD